MKICCAEFLASACGSAQIERSISRIEDINSLNRLASNNIECVADVSVVEELAETSAALNGDT